MRSSGFPLHNSSPTAPHTVHILASCGHLVKIFRAHFWCITLGEKNATLGTATDLVLRVCRHVPPRRVCTSREKRSPERRYSRLVHTRCQWGWLARVWREERAGFGGAGRVWPAGRTQIGGVGRGGRQHAHELAASAHGEKCDLRFFSPVHTKSGHRHVMCADAPDLRAPKTPLVPTPRICVRHAGRP